MLSIIVSSRDDSQLSRFRRSVAETVGVEHEIIVIQNSDARYSLTKAYNLGERNARFHFLLFVHEDVVFRTSEWGRILISHLDHLDNVGVIGIAGTDYKPFIPSAWAFERAECLSFRLIQGFKYGHSRAKLLEVNCQKTRKVVCLDGVFLGVRKDVFEQTGFDESIDGFHGYDVDFSLTVAERFQNYFVPDILIEHFSEGKMDDQWISAAIAVYRKWKDQLPLSSERQDRLDLEAELSAYYVFVSLLVTSSLRRLDKIRVLCDVTTSAVLRCRSLKFLTALAYAFRHPFRRTPGIACS